MSFVIGNGLVNEFEKRKMNTDIEYYFGIRFVSHPSLCFWEEKQKIKKRHRFRRLFKIKMWKPFKSYSRSRYKYMSQYCVWLSLSTSPEYLYIEVQVECAWLRWPATTVVHYLFSLFLRSSPLYNKGYIHSKFKLLGHIKSYYTEPCLKGNDINKLESLTSIHTSIHYRISQWIEVI